MVVPRRAPAVWGDLVTASLQSSGSARSKQRSRLGKLVISVARVLSATTSPSMKGERPITGPFAGAAIREDTEWPWTYPVGREAGYAVAEGTNETVGCAKRC